MNLSVKGDMPTDPEAERAVIGAVLLEPRCLADVAPEVSPQDFYHPANESIFEAMLALEQTSAPINSVSVVDMLRSLGRLERLKSEGGVEYLTSMLLDVVSTAQVAFHARAIALKAERRRWIKASLQIASAGLADAPDAEFLADAERDLMALTARKRSGVGPVRLKRALGPVMKSIESRFSRKASGGITGIPTNLHDLDFYTLGWQPSDLVIVAGRPGSGKTSLAMCSAVEAARAGHPVLFFSLEMSRDALIERVISMEGNIDSTQLRTGAIPTTTWVAMSKTCGRIVELPLWIEEEGGLTVGEIRSRARRWKLNDAKECTKPPLVIVDYIGLVRPNNSNPRNREREVAEISAELKAMAKDLGCATMALSQLNRSLESRADKRPLQSDLRESGSLEQDADVIVFVYRGEMYHDFEGGKDDGQCKECDAGVSELIVSKQRNGPTGTAHVKWTGESTKFANLSRRSDSNAPPGHWQDKG